MPSRLTAKHARFCPAKPLNVSEQSSHVGISTTTLLLNVVLAFTLTSPASALIFEDRVEVTGDATYTYGDNESFLAAVDIAKSLAIRKAIESYQVFVEATSRVQDFQLTQDLVKTIAAGYLHDLKIVEQTEQGRTIRIKVKGYVLPKEVKTVINQKLIPPLRNLNKKAKAGDLDCSHFSSQAAAQAELRKNPADPHHLDHNRDGIACNSNPPPRDLRPVTR